MNSGNQSKVPFNVLAAIFSVGLISFFGVLMTTAMNVNFPELMRYFKVPLSTIQWITTGYMIVSACTMISSSYISRRFPFRNIFMAGATTLIISLIICALAINFPMLLIGRLIGGISVGLTTTLMFNIISQSIPPNRLGFFMSFGGVVISIAPTIGPTYGGIISYYFKWQTSFWLVLPIAILITTTGLLVINNQKEITKNLSFDWLGFILASISLITLTIGISSISHFSIMTLVLIVIGILALITFGRIEFKNQKAILNTAIFTYPTFLFSFLAYFGFQMTNISLGGFLIPNFSQLVLNASVLVAGLLVLPGSLLRMIFMPISGAMLDKYGAKKPIYTGLTIVGIFFISMAMMITKLNFLLIVIAYSIYSIGFASSFSDILTYGLKTLPSKLVSDGNAAFNAIQIYGGAVGISVMSLVVTITQNINHGISYRLIVQHGARYDFILLFAIIILVSIAMILSFKGHHIK